MVLSVLMLENGGWSAAVEGRREGEREEAGER